MTLEFIIGLWLVFCSIALFGLEVLHRNRRQRERERTRLYRRQRPARQARRAEAAAAIAAARAAGENADLLPLPEPESEFEPESEPEPPPPPVRYTCDFFNQGCPLSLPHNRFEEHHLTCIFRDLPCCECSAMIKYKEIIDHYQIVHQISEWPNADDDILKGRYAFQTVKDARWTIGYKLRADLKIVVRHAVMRTDYVYFWASMIENATRPPSDYECIVTILNQTDGFSGWSQTTDRVFLYREDFENIKNEVAKIDVTTFLRYCTTDIIINDELYKYAFEADFRIVEKNAQQPRSSRRRRRRAN